MPDHTAGVGGEVVNGIPHDGPLGRLLTAAGRSPMRASHLHFVVSPPHLRTLVTHISAPATDSEPTQDFFYQ